MSIPSPSFHLPLHTLLLFPSFLPSPVIFLAHPVLNCFTDQDVRYYVTLGKKQALGEVTAPHCLVLSSGRKPAPLSQPVFLRNLFSSSREEPEPLISHSDTGCCFCSSKRQAQDICSDQDLNVHKAWGVLESEGLFPTSHLSVPQTEKKRSVNSDSCHYLSSYFSHLLAILLQWHLSPVTADLPLSLHSTRKFKCRASPCF